MRENGLELSDEELETIAGGWNKDTCKDGCNLVFKGNKAFGGGTMEEWECSKCGYAELR